MYQEFVTAIDNGATPLSLARTKQEGDKDEGDAKGKGKKGAGERNPWVNSGMLAAALALADKYPDDSRLVVKGVVRSIPLHNVNIILMVAILKDLDIGVSVLVMQ